MNLGPVITLNGTATVTVVQGQSYVDPGATATDDADGTVPVVISGSVNTAVAGIYTLYYNATDSLGYVGAQVTRTVTVTPGVPTVTAILPTAGNTAGGTTVTITGTNLFTTTSVTIGGTAATGVTVVNTTTITAITPAHAAGTVDVAVTTAGGTGTGTNLFTYGTAVNNPPTLAVNGGSGTPTLVATSSLAIGRRWHMATLLPDGTVLVTGGVNSSSQILRSAVLYDPVAGTWSQTGDLIAGRWNHTATLLANGKVMVTGGTGDGSSFYLKSAEIYDPATRTWTATGGFANRRDGHTATLLADGKVLVAGGNVYSDGNVFLNAQLAEVYDPAAEVWTPAGNLAVERGGHTATRLANGKVLVAGGYTASAELYDPATGTWAATGSLNSSRTSHTATLLPNGTVLMAGGSGNQASAAALEIYYPQTETFTMVGTGGGSEVYRRTATLLPSGKVVLAGGYGYDSFYSTVYPSGVLTYDPTTLSSTSLSGFSGRSGLSATLLANGKVLFAGGSQAVGITSSALLYAPPAGGTVQEGSPATQTGTFSDPEGNATVTLSASSGTVTKNNAAGTWSWSATGADGLTTAVTISATDSANAPATVTFPFTITNAAPTVAITAPATATSNTAVNFTFTATDPSSADQSAGFAWSINYGDGTGTQSVAAGTASPLSQPHIFANLGTFTVTATATDKDGGGSATASKVVTVLSTPSIAAIAPAAGSIAGGTSVTITGINLGGATSVTFGGTAATGVTGVNGTTITATTPGHAAGTVDVVVTTASGTGTGTDLFTYATVPGAPTIGTVNGGNGSASVAFTAPASDGGSAITGYTVTSSPGGLMALGTASPLTLSGLTNGTAYTFTVTATNAVGTGAPSAASNSVIPASQLPGTLDSAYNPNVTGSSAVVYATAVQPDGRTIIGGYFTTVGGATHTNLARLNADGSVDATFTASTNSIVYSVAVQTDGKLVLGGDFTSVNGTTGINRIARLNADGMRDTAFNAGGAGTNAGVLAVAVQADGTLVLGGAFTSVNGTTGINRIARLNADGTLDTTFNAGGAGPNSSVGSVAVQADGKLVLGGSFTSVNGTTGINRIARLNADGMRDTAFNVGGAGPSGAVTAVAVQADGKLVLGGGFTSVNGTTGINRIARLNADGTLDTTFNAGGAGPNSSVGSVAVQADGKLVLGGTFTSVNGTTEINRIARLNADGTRDTAFNAGGAGANNLVRSVAVQADGKLVLGGTFTSVNGTGRNEIARLNNDAATQSLAVPDTSQVLWSRGGAAPEISQVTFEQSSNGGSTWTLVGSATRVGTTANWQLTGLSLPTAGQLRARGRATNGYGNGGSGLIEQVTAYTAAALPGAPGIGTATGGNASATVTFTPPSNDGGSAITSYTATSIPGSFTGTGTTSPITVNGLTNGTAYTFTVAATNAAGTGAPSAASNPVTPATVPGLTTTPTSSGITGTGATLGGTVTGDGGATITERGVVYALSSVNPDPTIGGTGVAPPLTATGTTGVFPVNATGLTPNSGYSFKAYATNAQGTAYSSVATFSTDVTQPQITSVSPNLTVHATSPGGVVVSYAPATATDNVTASPVITYSQASGATFPAGTNTVTVTATDAAGNAGTATFTVTVTPLTATELWRYTNFGSSDNTGAAAALVDPDGDGLPNVVELGFLTDPMNAGSGTSALQYSGTFAGGGTIAATGQPRVLAEGTDVRAAFVRRSDFTAAGLSYVVEFTADFTTWAASAATPAVLADDGTAQIVSVPYPLLVDGLEARYFRVVVTVAP